MGARIFITAFFGWKFEFVNFVFEQSGFKLDFGSSPKLPPLVRQTVQAASSFQLGPLIINAVSGSLPSVFDEAGKGFLIPHSCDLSLGVIITAIP